jgi:hypothetical protein
MTNCSTRTSSVPTKSEFPLAVLTAVADEIRRALDEALAEARAFSIAITAADEVP